MFVLSLLFVTWHERSSPVRVCGGCGVFFRIFDTMFISPIQGFLRFFLQFGSAYNKLQNYPNIFQNYWKLTKNKNLNYPIKSNKILTLLFLILEISSEDCGILGNCCLSITRMVSARTSKSSLFSKLTEDPHCDFPSFSFWFIFLFHITMEASILFFRSRTLCSVDNSKKEMK